MGTGFCERKHQGRYFIVWQVGDRISEEVLVKLRSEGSMGVCRAKDRKQSIPDTGRHTLRTSRKEKRPTA